MALRSCPPRDFARHFPIVFELFGVGQQRAVILQEAMDLHTGFETEQVADIGYREPIAPISLKSNSVEGDPCCVLARGDELTGQFFRDLNGNGHGASSVQVWQPNRDSCPSSGVSYWISSRLI